MTKRECSILACCIFVLLLPLALTINSETRDALDPTLLNGLIANLIYLGTGWIIWIYTKETQLLRQKATEQVERAAQQVEKASQQVTISQKQLDVMLDQFKLNEKDSRLKEEASQPFFNFYGIKRHFDSGKPTASCEVTNTGLEARNVAVRVEGLIISGVGKNVPKDSRQPWSFQPEKGIILPDNFEFEVKYEDESGQEKRVHFLWTKANKIERIKPGQE